MKTVCAALILKNESKIIARCLKSIKPYIDYWVICDTGSTDETEEIVEKELSGISGELHDTPWENFGHNRTELIKLCKGKADYALLIDADETLIVNNPEFKDGLTSDAYMTKFTGDMDWRLKKLVSLNIDWHFKGVTHEHIDSAEHFSEEHTEDIYFDNFADGSRRPMKFEEDIKLLEEGIKNEPDNSRYMFYLAQSYFDLKNWEKAREHYEQRMCCGGWIDEVYLAAYKRAICIGIIEDRFPIEEFSAAHQIDPSRFEAIYEIISFFRKKGHYDIAYTLCKKEINKSMKKGALFADLSIKKYKLKDELAICAYWVGEYEESFELNEQLLNDSSLPPEYKERIIDNQKFAENKLNEQV